VAIWTKQPKVFNLMVRPITINMIQLHYEWFVIPDGRTAAIIALIFK